MTNSDRTIRITSAGPNNPLLVVSVALLTLSASCAAPDPSDLGSGTETVTVRSAETAAGWIDPHVPPDISYATSEAAALLSDYVKYTTAKGAIATALAIIAILGLTGGSSGSNVSALIQKVIAAIQTEYTGLAWQANTLAWGGLEGAVTGPIGVAEAYYNMNGNNGQAACPLAVANNCGISAAVGTIGTLRTDYNVLFGRPYNANAVAGSWQQVLAATRDSATGALNTALASPIMPGTSWVFDWRVGIPALAQFLSEYVQVYPLTDPNFQQDNTWDTPLGGLQDVRTWLEGIYTAMVQGVHADYMCSYAQPVPTRVAGVYTYTDWPVYCDGKHYPGSYGGLGTVSVTTESPVAGATVWPTAVAAADINSGIQANVGGVTPTTLGGNCAAGIAVTLHPTPSQVNPSPGAQISHYLAPSQSCLNDLKNNAVSLVFSKMPLADMRKTIDTLAAMQGTSIEIGQMPAGTIANCQAVADQYGIVQNSSWGTANTPALQEQWQESGCSARASWLDTAWSVRSSRPHDFDGDGKTDLAVFRPDNSGWRPLSGNAVGLPALTGSAQTGNGFANFYRINSSTWTNSAAGPFGNNTDVPVPGNYEGPGRAVFEAVWRPSNGLWFLADSSGTTHTFQWGGQGDIPLPADYDGDGVDDLMVWRPSTGTWYEIPSRSAGGGSSHYTYNNAAVVTQWGLPGDVPVPADYDSDGKTDRAVWRPSEGNWYILQSSGSITVAWGQPGDIPVPGNYDGLGTDLAIFRPSEGKWYLLNHPRTGGWWVGWGQRGDIPVPGDYDGDGKTDIAVFRPSNATWYWINSSTVSGSSLTWGETGDVPIP